MDALGYAALVKLFGAVMGMDWHSSAISAAPRRDRQIHQDEPADDCIEQLVGHEIGQVALGECDVGKAKLRGPASGLHAA